MKILLVLHRFPPRYHAGVENYTAELALALRARGNEVEVFTATKDPSRTDLQVRTRSLEGIAVHEMVNNLFYHRFQETFSHACIEERFAALLEELRPDIVHFHHLLYLSMGCAGQASRLGIPTFFTLHDFWLQCARFGQRIRANGEVCQTIDAATCARCMATLKYAQSPLERRVSTLAALVRRCSGIGLGVPLIALGRWLKGRVPVANAEPPRERIESMATALAERERVVREELAAAVDRFLLPSRFLAAEMLSWGLPENKLEHLRAGIDVGPFKEFHRQPSSDLRIAFAGTLVPHKGAHVLLDAWEQLGAPRGVRLTLHGRTRYRPEYVAKIRRKAARLGVEVAGELPHREIARMFAQTDLLVVPSLWFENAPLIILEALATGTALLVSDHGGMRELVEEGLSGFRFTPGDSLDLAAKLERVIRDRTLLDALYPAGPIVVRTLEEDACELEKRYRRALQERRK